MLEYFPPSLYVEILKWLPLNSILQCRTVCKSWNSVVSSNDFISAHHSLTKSIIENRNQTVLIRYFDRRRKLEKYIIGQDDETFGLQFSNIKFQYVSTRAYLRAVGYCDGVVCLSDDFFGSLFMVVLWNPSIRKSIRVKVATEEHTGTQLTVLGFGVCPRTHDPKLVRIVYPHDSSMPHNLPDSPMVDVFSLTSDGWRQPLGGNSKHPRNMIRITWSQVCFNGVIHWVACEQQLKARHRCLIMSFDLVHEVFDEMPLPDVLAHHPVSNLSINTHKGYLAMLEYDMKKKKESCGVWVMKEYGVSGSWEKLYVIYLPRMLRNTVGFRKNGDMVVVLKNGRLVTVDCIGKIKSLDIYGHIPSFFMGSYMESLIMISQVDNGDDGDVCECMEDRQEWNSMTVFPGTDV
ncbi:hypothetical protein L2E82_42539 [Cichorium intybus]|uniref:Uncharacterized protein n=1 Tax=Cichorium intybus TaxID=13427 RepID=A0ACB8ZN35_CICIN|nr:hypothetical protein L2E82_42539 [Cichorium intybus]